MKKFLALLNKEDKTIIGALSGTSIDAVDVVLVKVKGSGLGTKINVLDFDSFSIGKDLKNFILKCSSVKTSNVEDICWLNFTVGCLFADSIKKLISRNKLLTKDIDLK